MYIDFQRFGWYVLEYHWIFNDFPGFQSISEEQVTVLKETLKNNRQRAREERKARREAEHKARKSKRKV